MDGWMKGWKISSKEREREREREREKRICIQKQKITPNRIVGNM